MVESQKNLISTEDMTVNRRSGLFALAGLLGGLVGIAESGAKKKKKKKKKPTGADLGEPCITVADCARSSWQCAPYANSRFGNDEETTYCLLNDGDACVDDSDCAYGSCEGTCPSASTVCTSGCAYQSLGTAMAGTYAGGAVCLVEGVYEESVVIDKSLTITLCHDDDEVTIKGSSNHPFDVVLMDSNDVVIFRGSTSGSLTLEGAGTPTQGGVINFNGGSSPAEGTLRLERVTLINGNASAGGAIWASTARSLTLVDTEISNCAATSEGGGIFNAGVMSMEGASHIHGCRAPKGGGIASSTGGYVSISGTSLIGGTTAEEMNEATLGGAGTGLGGGVYLNGSTLDMSDDARVQGNSAFTYGGGIYSTTPSFGSVALLGNATCNSGKVENNALDPNEGVAGSDIYVEGGSVNC